MTNTEKLYPFSMRKHAHDLEYRRNRLTNVLSLENTLSLEEEAFMNAEREMLGHILTMYQNPYCIVFLNGREYQVAINAVGWAESNR